VKKWGIEMSCKMNRYAAKQGTSSRGSIKKLGLDGWVITIIVISLLVLVNYIGGATNNQPMQGEPMQVEPITGPAATGPAQAIQKTSAAVIPAAVTGPAKSINIAVATNKTVKKQATAAKKIIAAQKKAAKKIITANKKRAAAAKRIIAAQKRIAAANKVISKNKKLL